MKFTLMHWSDSHAMLAGTNAAISVLNSFDADIKIHTGDICQNVFENDISYANLQSSYLVIGNHDSLLSAGADPAGCHWDMMPTLKQKYEKFFKPYISNRTNVVQNVNETWWYKRFDDKKVLFIGLDCCVDATTAAMENLWFGNQLQWAIENGYYVVIASHIIDQTRTPIFNGFTTGGTYFTGNWGVTSIDGKWYKMVKLADTTVHNYVSNGCKVILRIYGHEHPDAFFNYDGFPSFCVGSTLHDSYNDVSRRDDANYTSCAVVNKYVFDSSLNTITMYRLGAGNSTSGFKRKMLCYDLTKKAVVSTCSRY